MKFKVKIYMLFVLCLFSMQINIILSSAYREGQKTWCWTKPIQESDKTTISPSAGGKNWGYCKSKTTAATDKVMYNVQVTTSSTSGSGSKGQFFIRLSGEEGQTSETLLTSSGFEQGITTIKKVAMKNVGDIKKIRLRNGGTDAYKCNHVRVELGPKFWDFDCSEFLQCPKKCYEDIPLAGNQRYEITVKTSSMIWADTKSPLYIEIIGLFGRTPKKILTEAGLGKGSTERLDVQAKDVGPVYGIVISETRSDMWIPQSITVKRGGQETAKFNPKGQLIKCPVKCSMTLMNPKPKLPDQEDGNGGGSSPDGGDGGSSSDDDDNDDGGNQGSTTDLVNDYSGSALTGKERSKLLKLTCESQVLGNDELGPVFAGNQPNYRMVLAVCPEDCWKEGDRSVFGIGLHAEESGICQAAIVDNSMPLFGGVIGIGITRGLERYEGGQEIKGIKIKNMKNSKKSFFTYKVDNVDMAQKDIRIIDSSGQPQATGRLEFRLNGVWGSICSKNMAQSAARRACRDLKYQDGFIKNPPAEDDQTGSFCQSFLGQDFCAPETTPIHYMSMSCEGDEDNVMKCYREIATSESCKHTDDIIVECQNENFDKKQNPKQGTVRIIDIDGGPALSGEGRAEIFLGKWGTICNEKFTDKAAQVACRQMGYDSGKFEGKAGENGACANFNGQNFCGQSNQQVTMKEVDCKGAEATLNECGANRTPNACDHDQDVILICDGQSGDPSGKSQNDNGKAGPPSLGKLPLIPIINADCSTQAKLDIFRGDPGSIFLVNCPEKCTYQKGTIWGSGIYTHDSSICRAAIHAGVIQDFGGLVEIINYPGQNYYISSTNRYITSTEYGSWKKSFVVAKPNSIAIKLSQNFGQSSSFLQIGEQSTYSSFLQSGMKLMLKSSLKSRLRNVGGLVPIFQWTPTNAAYRFDGKSTIVDTSGVTGVEKTGQLQSLSITLKIEMDNSPRQITTLVSHSGCGGYQLLIDAHDELIFKQRCTDVELRSGWRVPLNYQVSLVITYDTNRIFIYINGEMYNYGSRRFNFKCDKKLDIGSFSETQNEIWMGQIEYVQIYDYVLNAQQAMQLYKNGVADLPKGHTLSRRYTVDNRICISACTANPIPGTVGSPNPPGGAASGQGNYPPGANVQEGMGEGDFTQQDGPQEEGPASEFAPPETLALELKCDVMGTDQRFKGPTGKMFRVKCPKNCVSYNKGNVFGSQTYTDDSAICKAGIHAGFIKNEKGGVFLTVVANGEDFYESSLQNGIQSTAFGHAARSLIFKEAPPIIEIACNTTALDARFGGPVASKYTVVCPADCSKKKQDVFGDGVYTDMSSICQTAEHAGLMTDQGGEIRFSIEEGQKQYNGIARNGIKSQRHDEYIRSIRIIGDKANTCEYFKETYQPANVFNNWKEVIGTGARNKPSSWAFNTNPTQYSLAFSQTSLIQGTDYNYGSALVNQKFDCNQGLFLANVYMNKEAPVALLFQYLDERNFYAVEVNTPGDKKIRVIKKVDGVGDILAGIPDKLPLRAWYRFKIVFQYNNIQVWLQKDELRNIELIFNITDNSLQRGTVGIAVNGNNGAYFDGLEVREYQSQYGINDPGASYKRIWDQCLTGATEQHRRKFCKGVYGTYAPGVADCMKVHNYCEQCCDNLIPKIENILNYACWRGCVKESKDQEKRKNEQQLAEAELLAELSGAWRPKVGTKADLKPIGMGENSYFTPAEVIAYDAKFAKENQYRKLKLTLKYTKDDNPQTEEVIYPSPILTKCGESLKGRTDCADSE